MLCALTVTKDTVWVTFLASPTGRVEMYLHTAPTLEHDDFNITLDDIDYSTVAVDLGTHVSKANFPERAMGVWSFRGPMELKSLEVLEGRISGMRNNPVDLTGDDGLGDDFSDIPIKREASVETIRSMDTIVSVDSNTSMDTSVSVDSNTSMATSTSVDSNTSMDTTASVNRDVSATSMEADDVINISSDDDSDANDSDSESAMYAIETSSTPAMTRDEAIGVQNYHAHHGFQNQAMCDKMLRSLNQYGDLAVSTHLSSFY